MAPAPPPHPIAEPDAFPGLQAMDRHRFLHTQASLKRPPPRGAHVAAVRRRRRDPSVFVSTIEVWGRDTAFHDVVVSVDEEDFRGDIPLRGKGERGSGIVVDRAVGGLMCRVKAGGDALGRDEDVPCWRFVGWWELG